MKIVLLFFDFTANFINDFNQKENGMIMYLWIGSGVDPTTIQNLFGVAGTQQLNTEKCKLLELNTKISENVRSVIRKVNEQRKAHLKVNF